MKKLILIWTLALTSVFLGPLSFAKEGDGLRYLPVQDGGRADPSGAPRRSKAILSQRRSQHSPMQAVATR